MCRVLTFAPFDLVDLLFDFQTLQVIKLWLMRLELGVELVFASFFLKHHIATSVSANKAKFLL